MKKLKLILFYIIGILTFPIAIVCGIFEYIGGGYLYFLEFLRNKLKDNQ